MSRPKMTVHGRKDHGWCAYCKRTLTASTDLSGRAFTYDHVTPKALGGGRRLPCCRTCNQLKGDLHPTEWFWFIDHHPGWWRSFTSASEVRRLVDAEAAQRLRANEAYYAARRAA